MKHLSGFGRFAIGSVFLALAATLVGGYPWVVSVGGDPTSWGFDPVEKVLGTGAAGANAWRWAYLGMCLSSILVTPAAIYFHSLVRARNPRILDLAFIAAGASIGATAIAAAVLGVAGSSLISAYSNAVPAQQSGIALSFQLLRDGVHFGIQEGLVRLTFGMALVLGGSMFLRDRTLVAGLAIIFGLASIAIAIATLLGFTSRFDQYVIIGVMMLAGLSWTVIAGFRRLFRGRLDKSQVSSV